MGRGDAYNSAVHPVRQCLADALCELPARDGFTLGLAVYARLHGDVLAVECIPGPLRGVEQVPKHASKGVRRERGTHGEGEMNLAYTRLRKYRFIVVIDGGDITEHVVYAHTGRAAALEGFCEVPLARAHLRLLRDTSALQRHDLLLRGLRAWCDRVGRELEKRSKNVRGRVVLAQTREARRGSLGRSAHVAPCGVKAHGRGDHGRVGLAGAEEVGHWGPWLGEALTETRRWSNGGGHLTI